MRRPTCAIEEVSTFRRFAVLTLSCLFTAAGLFALQNLGYWKLGSGGFHNLASIAASATNIASSATNIAARATNSIRAFVGLRPTAPPVDDNAIFDKESTMSPSELLNRWNPIIAEASHRFSISDAWIRAVMRVESGGRTVLAGDKPIVSRAGALGVMQVMPETYSEMRSLYGLGTDPFNPHDNIFAAAAYLRWLKGKYGFPEMFAAYNGGPGTLDAFLEKGQPLPKETVNYISSVSGLLGYRNGSQAAFGYRNQSQIAFLVRERLRRHLHRPVVPDPDLSTIPVEASAETAQ